MPPFARIPTAAEANDLADLVHAVVMHDDTAAHGLTLVAHAVGGYLSRSDLEHGAGDAIFDAIREYAAGVAFVALCRKAGVDHFAAMDLAADDAAMDEDAERDDTFFTTEERAAAAALAINAVARELGARRGGWAN